MKQHEENNTGIQGLHICNNAGNLTLIECNEYLLHWVRDSPLLNVTLRSILQVNIMIPPSV